MRGGSLAGIGGASYALAQYTQAKRATFDTPVGNQIKDAIRGARPEFTDAQIDDVMGIISMDREYFDKYADHFGYPKDLGADFIKEVTDNDRRALRLQHEIKQRATYSWADEEVNEWEVLNDRLSRSVGSDSNEVIERLGTQHGIRVDVNDDVSEERLHGQLSQLSNVLDEYPILGKILRARGGRVGFSRPRPGSTAEATWDEDRVTIYNKQDSYVMPSTWVHEIAHGADKWAGESLAMDKVFGRGKQPTSYGWLNYNESWADTTMLMIMGMKGPTGWIEPDKIQMVEAALAKVGM